VRRVRLLVGFEAGRDVVVVFGLEDVDENDAFEEMDWRGGRGLALGALVRRGCA
jgi:hypothetical protein